jgi:ribose transport system permease protein
VNKDIIAVWKRKIITSQAFYLILIIIALSIVANAFNPKYLSLNNIKGVLSQIAVLGLISSGVAILIISGNFDISIGAIIGFSGTMMCLFLKLGIPDALSVILGIAIAVACSTLNGTLSVIFKAPSMIITLATTSLYTGLCLTITGGGNVTIFGRMEFLARQYIFGFLPLIFTISLIGYIVIGMLLKYTQFGRRVFAIGNNAQAAYLAGIKVNLNKIYFFVVSGIMTGTGVLMLVSRLGAFQASTGSGMELQAIGAVIIGGAPINGGKGDMLGTFCGVLLTGIIFNVLNLLRVNPYLQQISFGVLIILSIAISSLRLRIAK